MAPNMYKATEIVEGSKFYSWRSRWEECVGKGNLRVTQPGASKGSNLVYALTFMIHGSFHFTCCLWLACKAESNIHGQS